MFLTMMSDILLFVDRVGRALNIISAACLSYFNLRILYISLMILDEIFRLLKY